MIVEAITNYQLVSTLLSKSEANNLHLLLTCDLSI